MSVLCHRYKTVLQTASESIAGSYGPSPGILALNLGPVWSNADAYNLFGNNVIEISFKEWESPPGLGICPLDVIFSVCYSISSWLSLNEDHVVVRSFWHQSDFSHAKHSQEPPVPDQSASLPGALTTCKTCVHCLQTSTCCYVCPCRGSNDLPQQMLLSLYSASVLLSMCDASIYTMSAVVLSGRFCICTAAYAQGCPSHTPWQLAT